jgi:hypothetical protein
VNVDQSPRVDVPAESSPDLIHAALFGCEL